MNIKGISWIRMTFRPHAYCTEPDSDGVEGCGFDVTAGNATRVRSLAQHHAKDTGHEVYVDVVDRTCYTREDSPS